MKTSFYTRMARTPLLLSLIAASLFLLAIVLTTCQNPAKSSPSVTAQELCSFAHSPELGLGITDEADLVKWIKATHMVDSEQSASENGDSRVLNYYWVYGKSHWSASVRDGRLVRISQFELDNGPSFGQVIALLGAPEYTYGYVGVVCEKTCNYSLGLDYPHLGVSVYRSGFEVTSQIWKTGEPALAIQENMNVTEIMCYQSTSMETALRDAFGASAETVKAQMSMRSPWSGFGSLIPLGPR